MLRNIPTVNILSPRGRTKVIALETSGGKAEGEGEAGLQPGVKAFSEAVVFRPGSYLGNQSECRSLHNLT